MHFKNEHEKTKKNVFLLLALALLNLDKVVILN